MNNMNLSTRRLLLLLLLSTLKRYHTDKFLIHSLTGWPLRMIDETLKDMTDKLLINNSSRDGNIIPSEVLQSDVIDKSVSKLQSLQQEYVQNTIFEYMSLYEFGDRLESIQSLLSFALNVADTRNIRALFVVCDLLVDKILHCRIKGMDVAHWQRYVDLALAIHPLTLHFLQMDKSVVLMLYRAKSVAFFIGDYKSGALIDLMIGTEAMRHHTSINAERFRNVAARGRSALAKLSEWEIQLRIAPYLGILDFLDGHYQNAIGNFTLLEKTVSSPSLRVMDDIFVLYQAQSASMLGNFHLGTNLLRAAIRQATAQGSHTPPSMLLVQCATIYLAQGRFDESLELIDTAVNHISPTTDPVGWMCACSVLAYYHRLNGRLETAHVIMFRCMTWARDRVFPFFVYQTPYFIELLHDWYHAGMPELPGFDYQVELERCLNGPNQTLRTVALRLRGETCLAQDTPETRKLGLEYLATGRQLARDLGIIRERAKICVDMAQTYMEDGDREKGSSFAMEAWSLKVMFRDDPWLKKLSKLVPAPTPDPVADSPFTAQGFYEQVAQQLLDGKYETLEQCYAFLMETICQSFGTARGCLFRYQDNSGKLIVLASKRISQEEVASSSFLRHATVVEDALGGVPAFTAIRTSGGALGESILLTCIPFILRDSEQAVLYLEGDVFPNVARVLTPEALLNIGKLLTWELLRFHRRRPLQGDSGAMAINRSAEDMYKLVHTGEVMRLFVEQVDAAAQSEASVLIHGETGSGKELIARRIHAMSGRKGPFVAVNLSSMPEELFENEMLGHERGAFTGAMQRKIGFFELANNGTLFIDELPDISQRMQIKLLRILQERTFTRLGSTKLMHSNFRLVVATNRDLKKAIVDGLFREDLYYRICVIQLHVPTLRERKEDIIPIVRHYINVFSHRYNKTVDMNTITPEVMLSLKAYDWPGNVRELRNKVEEAVINFSGIDRQLRFQFETMPKGQHGAAASLETAPHSSEPEPSSLREFAGDSHQAFFMVESPAMPLRSSAQSMLGEYYANLPSLKDVQRMYIERVMELTGGKVDGSLGAARILGMTRSALYYHLNKLNLQK